MDSGSVNINSRFKFEEWKEADTLNIHVDKKQYPFLSKIKIQIGAEEYTIRVDAPKIKINDQHYIKIEIPRSQM